MFENEKIVNDDPNFEFVEYDCSYHPKWGNQIRNLKPEKKMNFRG